MMTLAEVQAALTDIQYRPGWEITASAHPYGEGLMVRIVAPVSNSYHPDETTVLGIDSYLPPLEDVADLHRWLLWRLTRIEVHEAQEWLRVGGRPIFDPHAERTLP